MCTHVLRQEGDVMVVREIDPSTKTQLLSQIHHMASDGTFIFPFISSCILFIYFLIALRTICLAYKDIHEQRVDWTDPSESNLVLLAILGIRVCKLTYSFSLLFYFVFLYNLNNQYYLVLYQYNINFHLSGSPSPRSTRGCASMPTCWYHCENGHW